MAGPNADIAQADPEVRQRLAEALEIRVGERRQRKMLAIYSHCDQLSARSSGIGCRVWNGHRGMRAVWSRSRLRDENERGQWRQGQFERERSAMTGDRSRHHGSGVADVAAAVRLRVAVQSLSIEAAARHPPPSTSFPSARHRPGPHPVTHHAVGQVSNRINDFDSIQKEVPSRSGAAGRERAWRAAAGSGRARTVCRGRGSRQPSRRRRCRRCCRRTPASRCSAARCRGRPEGRPPGRTGGPPA